MWHVVLAMAIYPNDKKCAYTGLKKESKGQLKRSTNWLFFSSSLSLYLHFSWLIEYMNQVDLLMCVCVCVICNCQLGTFGLSKQQQHIQSLHTLIWRIYMHTYWNGCMEHRRATEWSHIRTNDDDWAMTALSGSTIIKLSCWCLVCVCVCDYCWMQSSHWSLSLFCTVAVVVRPVHAPANLPAESNSEQHILIMSA